AWRGPWISRTSSSADGAGRSAASSSTGSTRTGSRSASVASVIRSSTMAEDVYVPRFKARYRDELTPALKDELGFTNLMQVPRLEKIVVNMGVGDAIKDGRMLDAALEDLTTITGQKPVVTKARKSIAGFKLREGMSI